MLGLLLMVLAFTFLGVGMGIITGLVPGIHVNTVATLVLIFSPGFLAFAVMISAPFGIMPEHAVLLVSAMIIGNLITHTFLDFIPSALLGAPDEDMALSVLPAHRLVLRGEGMEAVRLSAAGSLYAVLMGMLLLFPAYLFFGVLSGYEKLEPYIAYILILVVTLLIAGESEKDRRHSLYALSLFLLSGVFGWVVLNGRLFDSSPIFFDSMRDSAPIFAGLLGLFGLPALIQSMGLVEGLKQKARKREEMKTDERKILKSSFIGTVSGAFVGWFPGITSGSATVLASNISKDSDEKSFITAMSAVNTSNALFVILALFVIGRARSGALKVVQSLISPELWSDPLSPPSTIFLLLFSSVVAAAVAYPITIRFGSFFLRRLEYVEYRRMSAFIILFLVILCLLLAGPMGLYVAAIAAMIGVIPPLIGVNRVHLMGFLILPTILYFLGVSA